MKPGLIPLLVVLGIVTGCTATRQYTLTIAHLNDTHSHAEAVPVSMTIDGQKTVVQAGGYARLKTLVDQTRAAAPEMLLLHAGDAVQGTLYYTLFAGRVDFDLLNSLKVDVMTFGNHEFDGGSAGVSSFVRLARFPLVSSNIDFSGNRDIASLVPKRVVKEVNGERIGIIGLTTETTPYIVVNIGETKFLDAREAARREVAALEAEGINKIIVLSHLGYAEDLKLAAAVSGIDLIVGGHSHTLLGDAGQLASLGLTPEGPYPTPVTGPDGGRVLVMQAWQWGMILGRADVTFDPAGRLTDCATGATMPVGSTFTRNGSTVTVDSAAYAGITHRLNSTGLIRIVPEDPATAAALAPYTAQLDTFRAQPVAAAETDLIRELNRGPGVLGADSMLAAVPDARVALLNYGAVRRDLRRGMISGGDVLEVMPFANTLVLVDLTGAELKSALEEGIEFLMVKFGGQNPPALPYVAGISFSVLPGASAGQRVRDLRIRTAQGGYAPVEAGARYRTVVNSFMASGGDAFTTIQHAPGFRSDTGIIDSDAFRDYLKSLGIVRNPSEQRVIVLSPHAGAVPAPVVLFPAPPFRNAASGPPGVNSPASPVSF